MERRTKIVCTIGPASSHPERIRQLIQAGMNVARLNFSHGTHDSHRRQYDIIRSAAQDMGANVAIMMDLQGPKIRTGKMKNGSSVALVPGAALTISTEDVLGDAGYISTTYDHLPYDVKPGDRILIADGTIELEVDRVEPPEVFCQVMRGGTLGQSKGINLPGVTIAEPSLTQKDREDLAFGIELGVDFAALSFVRSPDDLCAIRAIVEDAGAGTGIVAKIERPEALARFDEILALSDSVMVARGDLGVEVPFEDVPVIQKRLIRRCNEGGVPVITATQMLESMVGHRRPTRAEVTDVANAIFDGTDAVMLSGETAAGKYPVEACRVMTSIALKVDEEIAASPSTARRTELRAADLRHPDTARRQEAYANAIGQAVSQIADTLDVRRIVCFTSTGYTASAIARYRPAIPITAMTGSLRARRRCTLLWGVSAMEMEEINDVDTLVQRVKERLIEKKLAETGDTVIIIAGTPLAIGGRTNLLKLHTID